MNNSIIKKNEKYYWVKGIDGDRYIVYHTKNFKITNQWFTIPNFTGYTLVCSVGSDPDVALDLIKNGIERSERTCWGCVCGNVYGASYDPAIECTCMHKNAKANFYSNGAYAAQSCEFYSTDKTKIEKKEGKLGMNSNIYSMMYQGKEIKVSIEIGFADPNDKKTVKGTVHVVDDGSGHEAKGLFFIWNTVKYKKPCLYSGKTPLFGRFADMDKDFVMWVLQEYKKIRAIQKAQRQVI